VDVEGFNIPKNELDIDRDVIALGKQNAWITQLGRKAEDGSFEEFMQQILAAKLTFGTGMQVEFDSPREWSDSGCLGWPVNVGW
jgi:hypothetical protein